MKQIFAGNYSSGDLLADIQFGLRKSGGGLYKLIIRFCCFISNGNDLQYTHYVGVGGQNRTHPLLVYFILLSLYRPVYHSYATIMYI